MSLPYSSNELLLWEERYVALGFLEEVVFINGYRFLWVLCQPPRVLGDWYKIIKLLIGKGVLGLYAFGVLNLPIAEKVKIAASFAGHTAPLFSPEHVYTVPVWGLRNPLENHPNPKCRKRPGRNHCLPTRGNPLGTRGWIEAALWTA